MNRRTLLRAFATIGATGTVGCLDVRDDTTPTTTLGWLGVKNFDPDQRHEIDLRVERDGEEVHRSSHTVEAKPDDAIPGAAADCTWDAEPGEYVVFARPAGGEWAQRNVVESFAEPPDCVVVSVRYGAPSHVASADPLSIIVEDRCGSVDQFVGGCSEYDT